MEKKQALEIKKLRSLAEEGFETLRTLESDLVYGADTSFYYESAYFQSIKSSFDTLRSVLHLSDNGSFKDCMVLLRHVFEIMLYFRLMAEGKVYRRYLWRTVVPNPGGSNPPARNAVFRRWHDEWIQGKHKEKEIISIECVGRDKILLIYEHEGIWESGDQEKKAGFLPYYLIVAEDYDPETKFISDLPSIKAGDLHPEITSDRRFEQHELYHRYLYFDAIRKNLILNKLISRVQADYVIVHYNYLSSFVHSTTKALNPDAYFSQFQDIVTWQILLYTCRMQRTFLLTILKKFQLDNPKARIDRYLKHISAIEDATSYFWFIDNGPTDQDQLESDQTKQLMTELARKNDPILIYYSDPLERLRKFGPTFLERSQ